MISRVEIKVFEIKIIWKILTNKININEAFQGKVSNLRIFFPHNKRKKKEK